MQSKFNLSMEIVVVTGYDGADLHKHLCTAIDNTAIGEVLNSVQEEDVEEMYLLYLHDFVRFEHSCNHKDQSSEDKEYQVKYVQNHVLSVVMSGTITEGASRCLMVVIVCGILQIVKGNRIHTTLIVSSVP